MVLQQVRSICTRPTTAEFDPLFSSFSGLSRLPRTPVTAADAMQATREELPHGPGATAEPSRDAARTPAASPARNHDAASPRIRDFLVPPEESAPWGALPAPSQKNTVAKETGPAAAHSEKFSLWGRMKPEDLRRIIQRSEQQLQELETDEQQPGQSYAPVAAAGSRDPASIAPRDFRVADSPPLSGSRQSASASGAAVHIRSSRKTQSNAQHHPPSVRSSAQSNAQQKQQLSQEKQPRQRHLAPRTKGGVAIPPRGLEVVGAATTAWRTPSPLLPGSSINSQKAVSRGAGRSEFHPAVGPSLVSEESYLISVLRYGGDLEGAGESRRKIPVFLVKTACMCMCMSVTLSR